MKNYHHHIINAESLAEIYFDEGEFEKHRDIITDDFKFVSPFGNFDNPDDYLTWLKEFYDTTQKMGGTRHFVMNPVITVNKSKDEAEFMGYLYVINKSNGEFMGTSIMKDRLRKTKDGWKFTYRSVQPDQDLSKLGE